MLIVGLQCGHDAAVTVLSDGIVKCHFELERKVRVRHANAMMAELIDDALAASGVTADEIDVFSICTTQSAGYRSRDPERLRLAYDWQTAESLGVHRFSNAMFQRAVHLSTAPNVRPPASAAGQQFLLNVEWPPNTPDLWTSPDGMRAIDSVGGSAVRRLFEHENPTRAFIVPMRVTFDGRDYPAVGVTHQLAHAAAAFYQSPFESAPVFSHDNGNPIERLGYKGGMLFYGEGHRLIPIWRAPVGAGMIYSLAATVLGLGGMAGPGKLMGLSAYGTPDLFDPGFIGDAVSLSHLYQPSTTVEDAHPELAGSPVRGWFEAVNRAADRAGFERGQDAFSAFGKTLAATAQLTFEELTLFALARLERLLTLAGRMSDALCLTGGCALNCPANSRIVDETAFSRLFVPPSCDDGGLSTGAAFFAYHHVFEHPRTVLPSLDRNIAYQGRTAGSAEIDAVVERWSGEIVCEEGIDVAARAADDLAADRIVAVFEGAAESGPRALGHRSLLADPRRRETWDRVNRLKVREWWRPFAPACLAEKLRDHFDGGPPHSPHMLFNYRVRGKDLGAVTHVDASARTQTVSKDGGGFRSIIEAFEARTGVPIVLNTSFNGPGEPIVDTADDALRFLTSRPLDALYLEGRRITRKAD